MVNGKAVPMEARPPLPQQPPPAPSLGGKAWGERIDWEASIFFPARLVAGAPAEGRRLLEEAGAGLFLLILEGLKPEQRRDQLLEELVALVREVQSITRTLGHLAKEGTAGAGLRRTHRQLEELVLSALQRLAELGHAVAHLAGGHGSAERLLLEEAIPRRPFATTVSSQPEYQRTLEVLIRALARTLPMAEAERQLAACWLDLAWVHTVLEEHVAPRGELSSLRPGEAPICRLAGKLAHDLGEILEAALRSREAS